jgi:uncharacterized protein YceK
MRILSLISTALFLPCAGCGTILNLTENGPKSPVVKDTIYGGIAWDAVFGTNELICAVDPWVNPGLETWESRVAGVAFAMLCLADLPLSAIADTLTLPITVQAAFQRTQPADAKTSGSSPGDNGPSSPPH